MLMRRLRLALRKIDRTHHPTNLNLHLKQNFILHLLVPLLLLPLLDEKIIVLIVALETSTLSLLLLLTPLEETCNRDTPVELPAMPELRCSNRPRKMPARYRAVHNSDNEFEQGSSHLGLVQLLSAAGAPGYRDPLTFKEAMNSEYADEWIEACQYEMDALAHLEVWCLEPLPEGRKAVKSKWVFKKNADGHFCACLVAKGFTQIEGVDFDETFSPVTRFESL